MPDEAFRNFLNSPFSAPGAGGTETIGLEVMLAHVASLHNPVALPPRFATMEVLFSDLGVAQSTRYSPQRRLEVLAHYEAYLARIYLFEQVIRGEALIRYLVKTRLGAPSSIPKSSLLEALVDERGNLLTAAAALVRSLASQEAASGSADAQANARLIERLMIVMDSTLLMPLVNFRNRIAHGYSRAFQNSLRRGGRSMPTDAAATEVFDHANLMIASSLAENLSTHSAMIYHRLLEYSASGTFKSTMLSEQADLQRAMPHLQETKWKRDYGTAVAAMPNLNLRQMITTPALAMEAFWRLLT